MINWVSILLSVIVVSFIVFLTSAAPSPTGAASLAGTTPANVTATVPQYLPDLPPDCDDAIQPVAAPFGSGMMDTVDTSAESGAQAIGATLLAHHMAETQADPIELECPDGPPPCPEEVVWRNTFPGCGSFHIPIEGKNYFRDERLWQGDLNPKIQERFALIGKGWDPYEYMNARQAWMQFIATNNSTQSDKYMKPIDDLTDVDTTRVTDIEPVPVY